LSEIKHRQAGDGVASTGAHQFVQISLVEDDHLDLIIPVDYELKVLNVDDVVHLEGEKRRRLDQVFWLNFLMGVVSSDHHIQI